MSTTVTATDESLDLFLIDARLVGLEKPQDYKFSGPRDYGEYSARINSTRGLGGQTSRVAILWNAEHKVTHRKVQVLCSIADDGKLRLDLRDPSPQVAPPDAKPMPQGNAMTEAMLNLSLQKSADGDEYFEKVAMEATLANGGFPTRKVIQHFIEGPTEEETHILQVFQRQQARRAAVANLVTSSKRLVAVGVASIVVFATSIKNIVRAFILGR